MSDETPPRGNSFISVGENQLARAVLTLLVKQPALTDTDQTLSVQCWQQGPTYHAITLEHVEHSRVLEHRITTASHNYRVT